MSENLSDRRGEMNFKRFVISRYVFKMDSINYEGKYMDRPSSKKKN